MMATLWPNKPSPKQWEFIRAAAVPEALYGGAAGSGKSEALLMAASRYVHHPGWNALLIRRTFSDLNLPGALLDRARDYWAGKPGIRYQAQLRRFQWQNGGAITFGFCEGPNDHLRYQGSELTFIGVDEASQIRPEQIVYLNSRLRKPNSVDLPLQLRLASNPGGIASDWLRDQFVNSNAPESRLFVPARVSDNPGIDADAYRQRLELLDPVTRAQLLEGNWDVRIATGWIAIDRIAIAQQPAPPTARRVRVWDLASGGQKGNDFTAGVLLAKDQQGCYLVEDVQRGQWTPAQNEQAITRCAAFDPPDTGVYVEQEPGSSGLAYISHLARNVLPGHNLRGLPATGDKQSRAAPLSAAVSNGIMGIVKAGWNRELLDELNAFPQGVHDDQVDALAHAYNLLSQRPPKPDWDILVL